MPVQKKELKNCNRRVYKRRGRKYFEVSKVFVFVSFFIENGGLNFLALHFLKRLGLAF